MPRQFQHMVCYSVQDRVTFANATWLGPDVPESERTQEHLEQCPMIWDFLQQAGEEGWELVTVIETRSDVNSDVQFVRTLYLKREIS